MKKLYLASIAALSILLAQISASAVPSLGDGCLMMYIGSYAAYNSGDYTQIDEDNYQVAPIIVDDRTLVPARFISESFGCEVDWDGNAREVTVNNTQKTIKIKLDEAFMNVEGQNVSLDVPAQIFNNRTMLPLRAITEALGKSIRYSHGIILIGEQANVDVIDYYNDDLIDNIVQDKFNSYMSLNRELKRRTPVYNFTNADEYGDGVLVSHIPFSNGGFQWQTGNIPYTELPVDENGMWAYTFTVYNDKLYYNYGEMGSSWEWPASIYRCDMSGENIELLAEDAACGSGIIVDGKLYYSSYNDMDSEWNIEHWGRGDGDINVINLDTGEKTTLIKGKTGYSKKNNNLFLNTLYDGIMIIANGWSQDYYWYDIETGASGRINKEMLPQYKWSNSECNIFFYNDDDKKEIRVLYQDTGEDMPIVSSENYIHITNVTEKYIFYQELISQGSNSNISKMYRIQRPDV